MFKPSEFTECYVIEMHWVGNMHEATVRVKITHKNVNRKYLEKLSLFCILDDERTLSSYRYPAKEIKGAHNEYVRYVYCEKFVDAYRIIKHYKRKAKRLISMVGYDKQHSEMGFDNLTNVYFGNEKISIDDYLK